jgi:hypothetical protein
VCSGRLRFGREEIAEALCVAGVDQLEDRGHGREY